MIVLFRSGKRRYCSGGIHRARSRHMHRIVVVLALLGLALVPAQAATSAPALNYIVVLKDGVSAPWVAAEHANKFGLGLGFVYSHSIRGYSAAVPAARLDALRADPRVAYV